MRIHVIDHKGQISPLLLAAEPDVSFFSDEIQALNAATVYAPDMVLLNYALRGEDTAEYVDLLLSRSLTSSIVIFGDDLSDRQVIACLLSGAKGYQNAAEFAHYADKIVKVIASGEAWITRRMTARLLDALREQSFGLSAGALAADSAIGAGLA